MNIGHNQCSVAATSRQAIGTTTFLSVMKRGMKIVLFTLLLVGGASRTLAEVLIIPNGLGGTLLIATNQTVFISHYEQTPAPGPYQSLIVWAGITNTLPLQNAASPSSPAVLSGPAEIQFLSTASHFLNYKMFQATSIQSFVSRFGVTNTIQVPTNKSVRFFQRTPHPQSEIITSFTVTQGTNSFNISPYDLNIELTGPLTVSVTPANAPWRVPPEAATFSYVILQNGSTTTPQGIIQAPSSALLSLEKSVDLKQWLPAAVIEKQTDPAAFYRLKAH